MGHAFGGLSTVLVREGFFSHSECTRYGCKQYSIKGPPERFSPSQKTPSADPFRNPRSMHYCRCSGLLGILFRDEQKITPWLVRSKFPESGFGNHPLEIDEHFAQGQNLVVAAVIAQGLQ